MTIKQKQALLFYLGYYVGNIDGVWGVMSKTATKAFQLDYFQTKDKVDGICGDETSKALKHAVAYGIPSKKTENTNTTIWDNIKYFDRPEFKCKCGKYCNGYPVEPDEKLVKIADSIRQHFGKRAHITSGIRCTTHNANVGGVSNSRHLRGKAIDFWIEGVTGVALKNYIDTLSNVRYSYIINENEPYVHMDID